MSAASALALLLASVPLTYGVTRPRHERWRARWRLRHHAPLDDSAQESDLVRASGIVRPLDELLTAPLSGRACVAYRSRVWTSSHPRGGIATRETMQIRPFVLDLGDEEVIIEGDRALFGLVPIRLVPRNPEREASFLARHALGRGTSPRFSEVALEVGARVEVGGTLVLVPRDEPLLEGELGFRDPPPPSQRICGNRERPLILAAVADDPV